MNRNQPKKSTNPVKAIREMCIECMGCRGSSQNYSKLIKECASSECALFDFRFGKNPYTRKRKLSTEHRIALQTGRDKKLKAFAVSQGKKSNANIDDLS